MKTPPKLRSDAAHNRERIIAAAFEAFAEHGRDACVEDIARRAGVGVGTLYRRFPTKIALAQELSVLLVDHIHTIAVDALAEQPIGEALETYVLALCGLRSKYGRALVWLYGLQPYAPAVDRTKALQLQMIADGKATGRLRPDLDSTDLGLLLWAVQGILEVTREVAPDAWRRLVDTVFAGWRASGTPLATPPLPTPPLTAAQSERISAAMRL